MDWLTFWSTIYKATLWPGLVLGLAWLFRKEITNVLPALLARLKSAKYPGGELTFSEQVEVVEEKVAQVQAEDGGATKLPDTKNDGSPADLVAKAWHSLATGIHDRAKLLDPNVGPSHSDALNVILASASGPRKRKALGLFDDLRKLQKTAELFPDNVTSNDARRVDNLVMWLRNYLADPSKSAGEIQF